MGEEEGEKRIIFLAWLAFFHTAISLGHLSLTGLIKQRVA